MKIIVFLYVFLFCLLKAQALNPRQTGPNIGQQQSKDCVKHPLIVKPISTEKTKVVIAEKVMKPVSRGGNSIPHFSVFNFINFFYAKDSLETTR